MNTCRECHPSFVKHARLYRDHLNKDPKRSYGIFKAAFYNDIMHRVEAIGAYNGTKEAADRTGGLLADLEVADLESNRTFPISMACHLERDLCNSCGNRARSREEYCLGVDEGGQCKHGGLRNRMGRLCEDGHHLGAENPGCRFFDGSRVPRQADMTAYALGPLAKAAEALPLGGAALAELFHLAPPEHLLSADRPAEAGRIKLACFLAAIEERLRLRPADLADDLSRGTPDRPGLPLNLAWIGKSAAAQRRALQALAREGVLLPLPDFAEKFAGAPRSLAQAAAEQLPGAFARLINEESLVSPWEAEGEPQAAERTAAQGLAPSLSLHWKHAQARIAASCQRGDPAPRPLRLEKAAAAEPGASQLARQYALYELAFAVAQPERAAPPVLELLGRGHFLR